MTIDDGVAEFPPFTHITGLVPGDNLTPPSVILHLAEGLP